jgi:RNA polymerase primary sigma factor
LLNEYEQKAYTAEQDDEVTLKSELTTALADIKKYFHSLSCKALTEASYAVDKQSLVTALQVFPFCFHDLTKLVDVIVYAYKFRGFCYQPTTHSGENNSHLILKRLEGLSRRSSINASKWLDILLAYDEQFLFLSRSDMHKYFTEVVFSEHLWLSLRQKLATENSRLVLFIANQYKGGFLDFDDLVQEGQTGLLKAVDRFDYRLGFQFSTYAGYWIRQAISRSLSRCERVVRVPCGQVANINKVFRAKDQCIAQTGREPTIKELAECAKLSNDEIHSILSISQTAMSLEGSDDENSFAPIDFLEQQVFTHSFMKIAQTDLENLINKAIKILNPREAKVICCHFGVDADSEMTLQEIGAELNLTRERVRQIQVMALDKIKRSFGEQLMSFL